MNLLLPEVRWGYNPIGHSSDDFGRFQPDELYPATKVIEDASKAGFDGVENGHSIETLMDEKGGEVLGDLEFIGQWHSTQILDPDASYDTKDFIQYLDRLEKFGAKVAIVAEGYKNVQGDQHEPLVMDPSPINYGYTSEEIQRLGAKLDEFAELAAQRDIKLCYHHHMGTGIQSLDSINELMGSTEKLYLLADAGHAAFAGISEDDFNGLLTTYNKRIGHFHAKDVDSSVLESFNFGEDSFYDGVGWGVFIEPGSGILNFKRNIQTLDKIGYQGWIVVEAERYEHLTGGKQPLERIAKALEVLKGFTGRS